MEQIRTTVTGTVFDETATAELTGEVQADGLLSVTIRVQSPPTGVVNVGSVRKVDANTLAGEFSLIAPDGGTFPFSSTLTRVGSAADPVAPSVMRSAGASVTPLGTPIPDPERR